MGQTQRTIPAPGSALYPSSDLESGYYQIPVTPESRLDAGNAPGDQQTHPNLGAWGGAGSHPAPLLIL